MIVVVRIEMKILINILSEQAIPNYIAIKEVAPDMVIALATDKYNKQVEMFKSITGVSHSPIDVKPYLMQETISLLEQHLKKIDDTDEVILNFTGGTKITAIASIFSIMNLDKAPTKLLYVNTAKNRCEYYQWQNNSMMSDKPEPFKTMITFKDFVGLAEEKIKSIGINDDGDISKRKDMTNWLFVNRDIIGRYYGECFQQVRARQRIKNTNKLDVVVTKGVRSALIECKAGQLKQEHLYKLFSLTEHLCGTFGTAFLVTTYSRVKLKKEYPEFLEKAKDMKIIIVAGNEIEELAIITKKYLTQ